MGRAIVLLAFGGKNINGSLPKIETFIEKIKGKALGAKIYIVFSSLKEESGDKERYLSIGDLGLIKEEDIYIIPLFLIKGIEYLRAKGEIEEKLKDKKLTFGKSILEVEEDKLINEEFFINNVKALEIQYGLPIVIVLHGSISEYSTSYSMLEKTLESKNVLFLYLRNENSKEELINNLKEKDINKVLLVPYLVLLGYHFYKDLRENIYTELVNNGIEVEVYNNSLLEDTNSYKLFKI